MRIVEHSYSTDSNISKVTVEVDTAITADVVEKSATYIVSIEGPVEFDTEEIYEKTVEKLTAAGINVMPF